MYKAKSDCEVKTHIKKTMNFGEALMDYLSNTKVNIIIEKKPITTILLELFRDKWKSLAMEEDSETAATAFQQFYLDNKAHMKDFLQRDDLSEIFDVNYVRTTEAEKRQPPDYQIGINFAAAEMDNTTSWTRPILKFTIRGKEEPILVILDLWH